MEPVANQKKFERGGGRKTIYQSPSSFIANEYNDRYASYTEKDEPIGGGAAAPTAPPPLESATAWNVTFITEQSCTRPGNRLLR